MFISSGLPVRTKPLARQTLRVWSPLRVRSLIAELEGVESFCMRLPAAVR